MALSRVIACISIHRAQIVSILVDLCSWNSVVLAIGSSVECSCLPLVRLCCVLDKLSKGRLGFLENSSCILYTCFLGFHNIQQQMTRNQIPKTGSLSELPPLAKEVDDICHLPEKSPATS